MSEISWFEALKDLPISKVKIKRKGELQKACREFGLPDTGKKPQVFERVWKYLEAKRNEESEEEQEEPVREASGVLARDEPEDQVEEVQPMQVEDAQKQEEIQEEFTFEEPAPPEEEHTEAVPTERVDSAPEQAEEPPKEQKETPQEPTEPPVQPVIEESEPAKDSPMETEEPAVPEDPPASPTEQDEQPAESIPTESASAAVEKVEDPPSKVEEQAPEESGEMEPEKTEEAEKPQEKLETESTVPDENVEEEPMEPVKAMETEKAEPPKSTEALPEESSVQAEKPTDDPEDDALPCLWVTGFKRPLNEKKVQKLFADFGEMKDFWMDDYKNNALIEYNDVSSSKKAYDLNETHWPADLPQEHASFLKLNYVHAQDFEEIKIKIENESEKKEEKIDVPNPMARVPPSVETERSVSRKERIESIAGELKSPRELTTRKRKREEEDANTSVEDKMKYNEEKVAQLFRRTENAKPAIYWKPVTDQEYIQHQKRKREKQTYDERREREERERYRKRRERDRRNDYHDRRTRRDRRDYGRNRDYGRDRRDRRDRDRRDYRSDRRDRRNDYRDRRRGRSRSRERRDRRY